MKVFLRLASVAIIIFSLVSIAGAEGIPNAKSPADVGFSAERLKKISAGFQKDVDKGDIPGAVIMVLRKGKVAYYDTIGFQDRENKIPMVRNTIFRIAR
jgi:CubicO group peptidase (beta-lactamase class C family)